MIEKNVRSNISFAIRWLTAESILYHAIFLAHQLLLFKAAGIKLYGIISVIFSLTYLATTIASFGLESSLSPFFQEIIQNKKNFRRFFVYQIFPTILLSILLSMAFILALVFLKNPNAILGSKITGNIFSQGKVLLEYFHDNISPFFILTIFFLILSESIKKALRAFLYIVFKNKINMIIEIASITIYISSIWAWYLIFGTITLDIIFVPMAITSIVSSFLLAIFVYKIYKTLPEDNSFICKTKYSIKLFGSMIKNIFSKNKYSFFGGFFSKPIKSFCSIFKRSKKGLQVRILKTRAINFANQFAHSIFSSNFLVPFFAIQFGLTQAAIFKLLSHISYTITMIMRKIFGWTCDTILAHTKNLESVQKKDVFHDINNKINNILLALTIFLTINISKIVSFTGTPESAINWTLIFFFLAITLVENLFISYEKFYIAEEKNGIILLINILSMAALSGIIFYSSYSQKLGQQWLLIAITIIRATFFAILAILSFYKWGIKPKLTIKPIYIALSIFISLIFFKFL